jgi:hypothetical protein
MRKLSTALALALAMAAASPAFAQSYSAGYGTGNIAPHVTASNPGGEFRFVPSDRRMNDRNGYSAYASEPAPRFAPSYGASQPSCAGDLGYGRPDYGSC